MAGGYRSDSELRAQSIHVLWEFRQLMRLAIHVDERRRSGGKELADPLDAAALEAFCVHARALLEFLWRDRLSRPKPRDTDAVAADWFDEGVWEREELPDELDGLHGRASWGVAHISYTRISPEEVWGWDHVGIAHRIAGRMGCFVADVPDDRVDPVFDQEATEENLRFRRHIADEEPGLLPAPVLPVGTPAHPSVWIPHRPER